MYKWLMFGLAVCGGCGGSNYNFEDESKALIYYPVPGTPESMETGSSEVATSETGEDVFRDSGRLPDVSEVSVSETVDDSGVPVDTGAGVDSAPLDTHKSCGLCLFKGSTLPLGADADSSKIGFGCCSGNANYTGVGKFTCIVPDCSGVSGKCEWWCGDHVCPDAVPCPGTSGD